MVVPVSRILANKPRVQSVLMDSYHLKYVYCIYIVALLLLFVRFANCGGLKSMLYLIAVRNFVSGVNPDVSFEEPKKFGPIASPILTGV